MYILFSSLLSFLIIFSSYGLELSKTCPVPKQNGNQNFYSQHVEDYILSMVFEDIDKGSYVDVGANDPNDNNVTKYFYLKGWRGINIEPLPRYYKDYLKYRPEDINLNIGIMDKEGVINLEVIGDSGGGWSTFNKNQTKIYKNNGIGIIQTIPVEVKTLNTVLQEHPIDIIHFITIDVETAEREVLLGIELKKHRPWVFLIESIDPLTHKSVEFEWKELLEKNGYKFILDDGLNSYFIADEHYKELYPKFFKACQCMLHYKNKGVINKLRFMVDYSNQDNFIFNDK